MRYRQISPSAELRNFVEYCWIGEIEIPQSQTFRHLSVANSKAELLFHYSGDFNTPDATGKSTKLFSAGVYGQTTQYRQYISSSAQCGIFGVRFFPHALPCLFSIPANELTNECIDITTLLGNEGIEVAEKLFNARTDNQKIKVVSDFLKRKLKQQESKYSNIEWAIHMIHSSKGSINLKDLVDKSCLSQRQFERNFKYLAGFSPASYSRIVRFEAVINSFKGALPSLTEVALEFGYYDQAHFNHDFKLFTGLAPTQYFNLVSSPLS